MVSIMESSELVAPAAFVPSVALVASDPFVELVPSVAWLPSVALVAYVVALLDGPVEERLGSAASSSTSRDQYR